MKYTVSVAIEGRIDVEVEAENFEQARNLAVWEAGMTNWNMMDLISCRSVNAEDKNGNFVDY